MNLLNIITYCKKGDRTAQKLLFDKFSKESLRLAYRYLNDRQYAEDACLEAFQLVFEGLKSFEYQTDWQTIAWIKRIVVNQSLKMLRQNRNMLFQQFPDDDFVESNEIGIEDDMSGREILELILKLPDGYRTVLNLYVVEGYSHQEIAQMLNITEGTSRSQLFKAKAMLKTHLEKLQIKREL
jgi:RNA polymerase sigma factor (sigma-70 family)